MLLGFAETSRFTRKIVKLLSDADFAEIQQFCVVSVARPSGRA